VDDNSSTYSSAKYKVDQQSRSYRDCMREERAGAELGRVAKWMIKNYLLRLSSLEASQGVVEVGGAMIERKEGETKEKPTQLEHMSLVHVSKRGSYPCSSIEVLIEW